MIKKLDLKINYIPSETSNKLILQKKKKNVFYSHSIMK